MDAEATDDRLSPCARAPRSSRSSRPSSRAWPRRDRPDRATTSRRRTSSTCCTRPRRRIRYVSPTGDRILLVSWVWYPPIAQVAEPFLKLAGVRVEPRTRRKHDTPGGYGIAPCAQTLTLVDVSSSREVPVTLPPDGCVDGIVWAADGRRFAFRNTSKDAVELWIGDAATGTIRRLGDARLNPMLGSSLQWMPDQKTLLVKLVPANAGPPPAAAVASDGPSIQETTGETGESSTYETRDTLSSKHDEDLFDYYATSQLAFVDADSGEIKPLGDPAIITGVDASPDGENLLVDDDPQAVLVRHHVPEFRARRGALGPRRPQDPHAREAAPRGSRADRRRADRPARFRVASDRTGDARLGRGARWRRLERQRPRARQGHDALRAVHGRRRRDRPRRAAVRRLRLERAPRRGPAPRVRREQALAAHVPRRRRASGEPSPASCGTCRATSATRTPAGRSTRCCRTASGSCARTAARSSCAARARRSTEIGRSSIASTSKSRKSVRLFRSDKTALESFLAFTGADRPRVPDVAPVADGSAERDAPHARQGGRVAETGRGRDRFDGRAP